MTGPGPGRDVAPDVHRHVPARRVVAALGVTLGAAAVELAGSRSGHSLFLSADALHLLAHVGIFGVLLLPAAWWRERGEDVATVTVLALVCAIAAAVIGYSVHALAGGAREPTRPSFMLLSALGLLANGTSAWLFAAPARRWWSFRAALAHELSDGGLTVAGLLGAGLIAAFGWTWVDPTLSLAIGCWLAWWAGRLLVRRARRGSRVWAEETVA